MRFIWSIGMLPLCKQAWFSILLSDLGGRELIDLLIIKSIIYLYATAAENGVLGTTFFLPFSLAFLSFFSGGKGGILKMSVLLPTPCPCPLLLVYACVRVKPYCLTLEDTKINCRAHIMDGHVYST